MNKEKRQKMETGHGTGVGMASVLMIVIVLALTSFGILALVSARADAAMSRRTEEFMAAYYAAEGRMAEQLAKTDAGLCAGTVQFSADGLLELSEEVREGQMLRAVLRRPNETGSDGETDQIMRYEIVRYGLVNTGEWNPEEEINVWDGGK